MKRLKMLVFAAYPAAALALAPARAASVSAPAPIGAFSLGGTAIGATNSHAIVSANGVGTPRIEYLSATSDATAAAVTFYVSSDSVPVTLATNASQAICWAVGTSFSANDKVVLRHVTGDTYERLVVSASTATNITFTANLQAAVVQGDLLYKQTSTGKGSIPVGVATKEIVAGGNAIFNGLEGKPIYLEVTGGTNCAINLISGSYDGFRWRRN